jgi:ferredoxin
MRVTVDRDLCQGHGMCVVEAPKVFALGKGDDQVTILQEQPDETQHGQVRQAAAYCPTMALTLEE